MGIRRDLALAAAVGLVISGAVTAPAHALSVPAIYGGTGASGNPGVVQLAIWDGTNWGACSAAMWKPRLLLTAAHCVTKKGGSSRVDRIVVFPPGASAPIYSNVGPVGASSVEVKQTWISPDYSHLDDSVRPNDFAIVELATDLAPPAYSRLATQLDIAKWATSQSVVEHVGYGLLGPGQFTAVPMTISSPITGYYPSSPIGAVFTTFADDTKGVCPGDSGSPVFRHDDDGSYVLVGTVAGGISPCIVGFSGTPLTSNFIGMAYLNLLNPALLSAGYAAVPSAPKGISLEVVNRDVVVTWSAPDSAPEAVAGYQVIDATGAVVCTTKELTCTVANLPDGQHAFTVRAVNADGDGDVLPVDERLAVEVKTPGRMRAPTVRMLSKNRVRVSFGNAERSSSAVVEGYVVTDKRGRAVCRLKASAQTAWQRGRLSCDTASLSPGTYTFFVVANTQMGDTPKSPGSKKVQIRR